MWRGSLGLGCVTSAAGGLAIIARMSLTMTKQLPYKTFILWLPKYRELVISYAMEKDYLAYVESLELQPHYNDEPETLSYSITPFCPTGADGGQCSSRPVWFIVVLIAQAGSCSSSAHGRLRCANNRALRRLATKACRVVVFRSLWFLIAA